MSKILITQEVTPETLFKWVGIVKTLFNGYFQLTNNGKDKTILALHFPVKTIFWEMLLYFNQHKIKKALCEFSIEENNIEITIKDYCSWYYFEKEEDNFKFNHREKKHE
jgi:hypothetical protein